MMLTASVVTISAVVLAYQLVLPQLWSGFQLVGDAADPAAAAVNACILGGMLIVFTTVINAIGVRLMAQINSTGVFIELIAAVLIIVLLAFNIVNPPSVLFDTQGFGEGASTGYFGVFLVASLASRLRHVRVRHRQLARRGDRRPSAHRAHGDPARRHRVVRHRRADPAAAASWPRPT